MKTFNAYILEGGYNVPVVSLSKDEVDLSKFSTRNEINRNLSAELSSHFTNPYGGWMKIRKVLEMYSITLPKVIFHDAEEGEEVVAVSQFGGSWGADLSGSVTSPHTIQDEEYYLYYSYGIAHGGFYEAFAVITDEEGLNDLISDDEDSDIEFEDEAGDTDSRQP